MEGASRETLCSRCDHLKVCKYVADMGKTMRQVDKIKAEIIELIKISVSCNMYRQNSGNIK